MTKAAEQHPRFEHYLIEKELADRLRLAARTERGKLYREVYDELFRRVPDHPLLKPGISDSSRRAAHVQARFRFLIPFLTSDTVLVEIGAGDGTLARKVSERAKQVLAGDVSVGVMAKGRRPANFHPIVLEGQTLPIANSKVDIAYSSDLLEHLHPEDAREHLREVWRVLRPGGKYICYTPNRLTGPHDVSRYFSKIPTGLHLREYTLTEVALEMKQSAFDPVEVWRPGRRGNIHLPLSVVSAQEALLEVIPRRLRNLALRAPGLGRTFGWTHVVGAKAGP